MQWERTSGVFNRLAFRFSLILTFALPSPPCSRAQTNPSWQRCYGGSDDDWANSLEMTYDGGCILAGMTRSNDGDVSGNHGWMDAWILKLSPSHQVEWQRCFGGDQIDEAYDVQQTLDGGYVVVGGTRSSNGDITENRGGEDYFVLKLGPDGSKEWVRTYGGSLDDRAVSVVQAHDGGYLVCGYILSDDGDVLFNHGAADIWVLKLDANGDPKWQMPIGGTDWDIPEAMIQTKDYGFIVAGHSYSENGDVTCHQAGNQIWVVKVSPTWSLQWDLCLPGKTAHSVIAAYDTGYIVGGEDLAGNGVIYRLDREGGMKWHQNLNGAVYGLRETLSCTIMTTGQGNTEDSCRSAINYQLAELDADGIVHSEESFGGQANDWARAITLTYDGGIMAAGGTMSDDCDVEGNHNAYLFSDIWVMTYGEEIPVEEPPLPPNFSVRPNPATNYIRLEMPQRGTIDLFSSHGIKLESYSLDTGIPLSADLSEYPAGLYILVHRGSGQAIKLVKE
jgi:hypothetical protein